MRMMTGDTILAREFSRLARPVSTDAPVNTDLPVAVCWSMAARAKERAFFNLQLATVLSAQHFEIRWIVAIIAVVVAILTAMAHDQIFVFFRKNDVPFVVEFNFRRFV